MLNYLVVGLRLLIIITDNCPLFFCIRLKFKCRQITENKKRKKKERKNIRRKNIRTLQSLDKKREWGT